MIETKLSTIVNSIEIMQRLANSPVKGRTAYNIGKIIKKIEQEVNLFYDTRTKIVNKYGVKDENGELIIENDNYKINPDLIEEFNLEVNNLLETVVVINVNPIKLEELAEIEITPAQMILIEDFIQE